MDKIGVSILGSTGSIGQNTLKVIQLHTDLFDVVAISAHQNVNKLFEQCCQFKPAFAVMSKPQAAQQLKSLIKTQGLPTKVLQGEAGLSFIAQLDSATKVVCGIVGAAGLLSTLSAVDAGKQVLIANKEPLVMAGDLLISRAKMAKAILLPLDSEHNALFQCMPAQYRTGFRAKEVAKIILTASGGPFLSFSAEDLLEVTPEMACQHPNWKMGKKITVDCATLMNKGLEVIEASKLFQLHADEIEVIVHPQSIIHSLVVYLDGSQLAQLGVPDMRVPITHCLSWPDRLPSGAKQLNLIEIGQLNFLPPDLTKFPCLKLAYEALKLNNASPVVLNASNEVAVRAFIDGQISFMQIPIIVDKALQKYGSLTAKELPEIINVDHLTREYSSSIIRYSENLV